MASPKYFLRTPGQTAAIKKMVMSAVADSCLTVDTPSCFAVGDLVPRASHHGNSLGTRCCHIISYQKDKMYYEFEFAVFAR